MSFLGSDTKVNPTDNRVTLTDEARYNTGASLEAGSLPKKLVLNVAGGIAVPLVLVVVAVGIVGAGVVWWFKRYNKS